MSKFMRHFKQSDRYTHRERSSYTTTTNKTTLTNTKASSNDKRLFSYYLKIMPLCFCCLSTAEKVNIVMSNFGALNRLNNVEQSEFPQFLCGRILPVEKTLQGPISGKECVYYEAVVEKLEDKTDENGLIGIPDPNDRMKVWIPLYFEKKSADFVLLDPAFPTVSVYVPGSKNHVKVLATEDTSIKTANLLNQQKKAKVTVQNSQLPPQIEEFLKRGKVELSNDSGVVYRYRESSFEKGEQVAVLGVVEQITAENNEPINILRVVRESPSVIMTIALTCSIGESGSSHRRLL